MKITEHGSDLGASAGAGLGGWGWQSEQGMSRGSFLETVHLIRISRDMSEFCRQPREEALYRHPRCPPTPFPPHTHDPSLYTSPWFLSEFSFSFLSHLPPEIPLSLSRYLTSLLEMQQPRTEGPVGLAVS